MRLLYSSGPGDTIGTFRLWLRGEDDPSVPDVAYSRQFFDVCKEHGADAWVISSNPRVETVEERGIRVEHRPVPSNDRSGLAWHAGRVRYTRGLLQSALEFRADVVVVSGHGTHWFPLKTFVRHGIQVVACLHNTLWPLSRKPGFVGRTLLRWARPLFARDCLAVLSHPGACVDQVAALTDGTSRPVVPFLPYYRPAMFDGIASRLEPPSPFRVLFVGRIEHNKGVYDLLDIARQFRRDERNDIEFDLCGTGSVLEALKNDVAQAGLGERFRLHGFTYGAALRERFARSHVVVVPTRSSFTEGFNAVVSEAVLSGRPVITSRVCPALGSVADAAVEVQPDDVAGYRAAIERLAGDSSLYAAKREACARVAAQFLDPKNSWGAGLSGILKTAPPR
jgi:glycosyltransferase involved in cell wall biosynthesis